MAQHLVSINPATGEQIQKYRVHTPDEVEERIEKAELAFQEWRRSVFAERQFLLRRTAELLRVQKNDFARLMAEEMGKPLAQGVAEIEKCAWVCEYYAEKGEEFLQDIPVETDASRSYVHFEPLGVLLAIMPWNFPFWQVFRFLAPALMAGNAVVLKHASNVTGCALAIEHLLYEAGAPKGLFATLILPSSAVEPVIRHPLIRGVTLTGSTAAGQAVAAIAGSELKKTVMELGGSDPYVVLEDADLDPTVETCVTSRLINSGQSCIAAKRFIVVHPIYERFVEKFVEAMRSKVMGNPLDDGIDLGPQARTDLRDSLHQQVVRSVQQGARLLLGGTIPDRPGAFYPPTVLADVQKGMPVFDEETFGPVAAIIPAADEYEAVQLANSSSYGLGAAVFTQDLEKAERIAREHLEAGNCFVNAFVRSDPRLPFGGIKASGYGRELSVFGIREFVNIKTVWIR